MLTDIQAEDLNQSSVPGHWSFPDFSGKYFFLNISTINILDYIFKIKPKKPEFRCQKIAPFQPL